MPMIIKKYIRRIIPPILVDWLRHAKGGGIQFIGRYDSWEEATSHAQGYDSNRILEKVRIATRAVIDGNAAAERDSVLFDKTPYPFPLIAVLLRAASENGGSLVVLDFGGALGSTYYQCRDFLQSVRHIDWAIVEQPAYVECGRSEFEQGPIKFYDSIASAKSSIRPTVVLLSGVLQYISEPKSLLEEIQKLKSQYVVIDRTPIVTSGRQVITVQAVPKAINKTSYPARLFAEKYLLLPLRDNYEQVADFEAVDGTLGHGALLASFRGYIFKWKDNSKD
jgi:putative methyltransferase (TIGR04325 family)